MSTRTPCQDATTPVASNITRALSRTTTILPSGRT